MDEQRNQDGMPQQDQTGGQSGAGYGDQGNDQGGMDSSGGTGSTGDLQGSDSDTGFQQGDQSIQRSETIEAEDIEFEADEDLIEDDDES